MTEVKAAFRSLKLYSMEGEKAQRIAAKNVRSDVLHAYFHFLPLKQQVYFKFQHRTRLVQSSYFPRVFPAYSAGIDEPLEFY